MLTEGDHLIVGLVHPNESRGHCNEARCLRRASIEIEAAVQEDRYLWFACDRHAMAVAAMAARVLVSDGVA